MNKILQSWRIKALHREAIEGEGRRRRPAPKAPGKRDRIVDRLIAGWRRFENIL